MRFLVTSFQEARAGGLGLEEDKGKELGCL
jgi:hypothetical protein